MDDQYVCEQRLGLGRCRCNDDEGTLRAPCPYDDPPRPLAESVGVAADGRDVTLTGYYQTTRPATPPGE